MAVVELVLIFLTISASEVVRERPRKDVDVICHSAYLQWSALQTPQRSRQIGVHLRSQLVRLQKCDSVLGGEDDVHQYESE
jgi:hypothetical protein